MDPSGDHAADAASFPGLSTSGFHDAVRMHQMEAREHVAVVHQVAWRQGSRELPSVRCPLVTEYGLAFGESPYRTGLPLPEPQGVMGPVFVMDDLAEACGPGGNPGWRCRIGCDERDGLAVRPPTV
jgi:hypothetical protein